MEVSGIKENRFVIDLFDIEKIATQDTGGKASNLALLYKAGFNVPKGFVVTTVAYSSFTAVHQLDSLAANYMNSIDVSDVNKLHQVSVDLREKIEAAPLPDELISVIKTAYKNIGSGPVAIRSSATAEDLPDASFAGQYDTSLYIEGEDNVVAHIKRCFSSVWTDRAIAYRNENNIDHNQVRLAVVVQSMVDVKSAGVMFTKNPVSDSDSEILIESNFGLGESVVSGYAIPDRYIVSRTGTTHIDYSLVSREIGTKEVIIKRHQNGQGIVRSQPTTELSQKSSLEDDEIVRLAKIGDSIEHLFQSPQDIEWAIDISGEIHILQARPIVEHLKRREVTDDIFWTRGYADDYWNDPVTPLFYSLLGDQITHIVNIEANAIMGYKNVSEKLLRLYKSHVYFNLDVLKIKVVNEMPPFIRSDDVMNYFPEGSGPYGKDTMRKLPFALKTRIMSEIRIMLLDGDGSMTKTNSVYEKWTRDVFEPACEQFDKEFSRIRQSGSMTEFLELADELDKTMMRHFRMVRYGLPVHTLGMNLITNYLLHRWLGEKAAVVLYPILVSGLDHKTSETNQRIRELADTVRENPVLTNQILSTPSQDISSLLEKQSSKDFLKLYNEFLEDFGDRGFTREPYYPRWREEPKYVFDVLKSLISEKSRNIDMTETLLKRKRMKAEQLVEDVIRNQRYGPIKWALFSTILGMARTYIGFRENQRFNLDRWITRERLAYLEIGRLLVEQGKIRDPIKVFFLFRSELRRIIRGTSNLDDEQLMKLIDQRYEEYIRYENVTPPKFLHGDREFDDPIPESLEGLKGMPASHGVISGIVRVIGSIEEVTLVRAGEILVVPRTDPGWTPVFSKISGLVTETGGILSHGAVVSREYGIPAVTNVRNACQIFKTGQRVTVDGNNGVVVIHDKE